MLNESSPDITEDMLDPAEANRLFHKESATPDKPWFEDYIREFSHSFRSVQFEYLDQPAIILIVVSSMEENVIAKIEELRGWQYLPHLFQTVILAHDIKAQFLLYASSFFLSVCSFNCCEIAIFYMYVGKKY